MRFSGPFFCIFIETLHRIQYNECALLINLMVLKYLSLIDLRLHWIISHLVRMLLLVLYVVFGSHCVNGLRPIFVTDLIEIRCGKSPPERFSSFIWLNRKSTCGVSIQYRQVIVLYLFVCDIEMDPHHFQHLLVTAVPKTCFQLFCVFFFVLQIISIETMRSVDLNKDKKWSIPQSLSFIRIYLA